MLHGTGDKQKAVIAGIDDLNLALSKLAFLEN